MAIKLYRNRLYRLEFLPVGVHFRSQTGSTGWLLKCNQCNARVKLENPGDGRRVQFTDADGQVHDFVAKVSGERDWAPGTEVYVLDLDKVEKPAPPAEPDPAQEKEWFDD